MTVLGLCSIIGILMFLGTYHTIYRHLYPELYLRDEPAPTIYRHSGTTNSRRRRRKKKQINCYPNGSPTTRKATSASAASSST